MNIFQEVKELISLKDIVRAYGIELNRNDMCLCPFHNEKTASMKVYDKGFRCYGCGEGGDTIYFVQKFFNLNNTLEAAHKINEDFNLNIDTNYKPTKSEFSAAQKALQERKKFERDNHLAGQALDEYHRILHEWSFLAPKSEAEIPDMRFIEYLQNYEELCYVIDKHMDLSRSPLPERIQFLKEYQPYIAQTAKRLLEIRQPEKQHKHEKHADNENSIEKPVNNIKAADFQIIGNIPYKNINNKSYLKYSNNIAPQIADKLNKSGVKFSGKVFSGLTTFTVNAADLTILRSIASNITREFTDRNKPFIIPSKNKISAPNRKQSDISL